MIFLATDDRSYIENIRPRFVDRVKWLPAMRTSRNVLYDDNVDKDAKASQVLRECLLLAMSDELVKCWSGVSEFAVYFRKTMYSNVPSFTRIVDLEATDVMASSNIATYENEANNSSSRL
mmetsp:Transcript_4047/g.4995  ORF Transcript_4047/g.4995 Transcript_4047/m.4995 type:complete len:120 (+) Transcript_4047:78-437(+)